VKTELLKCNHKLLNATMQMHNTNTANVIPTQPQRKQLIAVVKKHEQEN